MLVCKVVVSVAMLCRFASRSPKNRWVTSVTEVDAAFKAVEEHFGGPVEVLVSNAGMTKDMLLLRMGEDDFTSVIDANLTAAYRVSKRAAQGMPVRSDVQPTDDNAFPSHKVPQHPGAGERVVQM